MPKQSAGKSVNGVYKPKEMEGEKKQTRNTDTGEETSNYNLILNSAFLKLNHWCWVVYKRRETETLTMVNGDTFCSTY